MKIPVKNLLLVIINVFICIAVAGCMKINNTEYTEDVSEEQKDMELYSYKMEFHKYPEIAELIEIIKTNAKIKKDFIEKDQKDIEFKEYNTLDNDFIRLSCCEDNIEQITFCTEKRSETLYDIEYQEEDYWDNSIAKKFSVDSGIASCNKLLDDLKISDNVIRYDFDKWHAIDENTYVFRAGIKINNYDMLNFGAKTSKLDAYSIVPGIFVIAGRDGIEAFDIMEIKDILSVDKIDYKFDSDKAKLKIDKLCKSLSAADEDWEHEYSVGEGKLAYITTPYDVKIVNDTGFMVKDEYRMYWKYDIQLNSTGKDEFEGQDYASSITAFVDVETGEVSYR